jgi:hypothetical protein
MDLPFLTMVSWMAPARTQQARVQAHDGAQHAVVPATTQELGKAEFHEAADVTGSLRLELAREGSMFRGRLKSDVEYRFSIDTKTLNDLRRSGYFVSSPAFSA